MTTKLQNYDENALGIIKNADILTDDDFKAVEEMKEEMRDVFLHSQLFRTETEMKISVLKDIKHPTADSKFWQAVREQNVMFNELVMLSYEYRKRVVNIKKLKRDIEREQDELERELISIEIDRNEFILKNEERTAKDRIRELKLWHKIKEQLKPKMKYSQEDVNEHQMDSLGKRFALEAELAQKSGSLPERINAIGLNETVKRVAEETKLLK